MGSESQAVQIFSYRYGLQYGEILYDTEVRWLSRGKVLKRFFELRSEITLFMKMKNKEVSLLADSSFKYNLAFLVDITHHSNELNFRRQGKKQIITQVHDHVKLFKAKLGLSIKQLDEGNLVHISQL